MGELEQDVNVVEEPVQKVERTADYVHYKGELVLTRLIYYMDPLHLEHELGQPKDTSSIPESF